MDSRNRRNLTRINDELQDVQRIMMQNIDDVLQRGEQLSGDLDSDFNSKAFITCKSPFIPRICNSWNILPSSFPESYNFPSFKLRSINLI